MEADGGSADDVGVGVGLGAGVGGGVVLGDDPTDGADEAAATGGACRITGGRPDRRTGGVVGGSTTVGRAVVAVPASMVMGVGGCRVGTSAGSVPPLGEAVAGARLPVPAVGAASGVTDVGAAATACAAP
jgi:hypothetical protein